MLSSQRILCVTFPEWPLQRWLVARRQSGQLEDDRQVAVVLHASRPRRGRQVIAASFAAQALGVRVAMPLAEAKAVLTRSSSKKTKTARLDCEPHDPATDRETLEKLAAECWQFSPLVGWEEGEQPSSLLLNVTGVAHLFGNEETLARQLQLFLRARGYCAAVAIADTVGAAWALSHSLPETAQRPFVMPVGDYTSLETLPLRALRLEMSTLETLRQLGIELIGGLLRLPRTGLAARFPPELLLRLDQALGNVAECFSVCHPEPQFTAEWLLEHPCRDRDTLFALLEPLLARVATQLQQHGRGVVQLTGSMRGATDSKSRTHRWQVGLHRPTADPRHLQQLVHLQLERDELPEEIEQLVVTAAVTARLHAQQTHLFDADSPSATAISQLLERLSCRLGEDCVLRGHAVAEALPEHAVRYTPLTGSGNTRRKLGFSSSLKTDGSTRAAPPDPLLRPLLLLQRPQAIEVAIDSTDRSPRTFWHQQVRHEIVRHWGPERIETGWWRGMSVRRDYYHVETASGSRFWLFRHLRDHQWYLHGEFA